MTDELFERGLKVRTEVLGRRHVEQSRSNATDLDRDFQTFITRCAWGEIWSRPGLDRKTRSMLTIALLTALGHFEELKLHIRATRNTGVSREEVREVLLHTAIYAGIPSANTAFREAREMYEQMEKEATP